uniref:Uncharacterized protein n=1 Tax=Leersia perrieri TaxID=77586 RepID=A0A0D9VSX3_9ORYZ
MERVYIQPGMLSFNKRFTQTYYYISEGNLILATGKTDFFMKVDTLEWHQLAVRLSVVCPLQTATPGLFA